MKDQKTHFSGTYSGKKVLVTGHTGFKGAWLCEWLVSLGADVAGFSLGAVSTPSLFEVNGLSERIKHFEGDIRDYKALLTVFGQFKPEIVFHLAAQSLVRSSYDDPKATFDTNVGGTTNCLEAIRATPSVKCAVIVTTDKCYENVGSLHGYRETDRLGGKDPYSASKAAAEIVTSAYIRSFFAHGPAVATVRAGNVIGGGDWAVDRIIPDCVRSWQRGETVTLRNPKHVRPWQHVLEPLSGYLWLGSQLMKNDSLAVGEAFNFGPDDRHCQTVESLVSTFATHWKNPANLRVEETSGKAEAHFLMLNCEKALQHLKWKPILDFSQTVQFTSEWYDGYLNANSSSLKKTSEQINEYVALATAAKAIWTL